MVASLVGVKVEKWAILMVVKTAASMVAKTVGLELQ